MYKIKKLVIATRNPAKIDYYRGLFVGIVEQVLGLVDVGISDKPTETGDTAEDNAQIKARFYSSKTNFPVFCEDEALYVDFLPTNKQPGTHVRRINGRDDVTDNELLNYWENIIKNIPEDKRTGYWHIAYCLALDGKIKTVSMDHKIMFFYPPSKTRIPGWPMSSLEGSVILGKPNSDRTEEEKQQALYKEAPVIIAKLKDLLLRSNSI